VVRFEALGAKVIGKWNVQTNYYKRASQSIQAAQSLQGSQQAPQANPQAADKSAVPDICLVHFSTDTPDKVASSRK
jgi:hypothetical protein